MTGDGYLAGMRARAETRMRASCRVIRKQLVTLDTGTLNLTDDDPSDDVVLQSACRIKSASAAVFTRDAEGQLLAVQDVVLCLPVASSGAVRVRDEVEIVDGGPDPNLTGRIFRVTGLPAQTEAAEARFPVEQTS